jgi:hypothetical protein
MSEHAAKRKGNWFARLLRRTGLVLLGILLYAVCINIFSGYPQYGTPLLNWIAVILISITAGIIWIRFERHSDDDD